MKLRCAVLLRLGWKGVKIFFNVSKVCMYACWLNWHPNLWSNLNSKKLLETETSSCGFNKVGLKGGESILECLKSLHARSFACLKLRRAVSTGLGLKGVKIAWNVAKVGVHACLSNMHPNIWSGLNSKNLVKAETASCRFVRVWLKEGENSSQHRESWHALLFSKCGFKSMIKF